MENLTVMTSTWLTHRTAGTSKTLENVMMKTNFVILSPTKLYLAQSVFTTGWQYSALEEFLFWLLLCAFGTHVNTDCPFVVAVWQKPGISQRVLK